MQQCEPRADQSHVVIQRQPTDSDVVGLHFRGGADSAHVREQIRVRQRDAFRVARRTRCVL